jgi:hypothetical protein
MFAFCSPWLDSFSSGHVSAKPHGTTFQETVHLIFTDTRTSYLIQVIVVAYCTVREVSNSAFLQEHRLLLDLTPWRPTTSFWKALMLLNFLATSLGMPLPWSRSCVGKWPSGVCVMWCHREHLFPTCGVDCMPYFQGQPNREAWLSERWHQWDPEAQVSVWRTGMGGLWWWW